MSTTIDNKVVQMQFDNKQFESNVQTSMSTLEKLKQSLNFSGAAKSFDALGNSANNVNFSGLASGVNTVKLKFSAMEAVALRVLQNITDSAFNAGKQLVSSLTVEPISEGFSEYELKMNSVQTIMAGTGADLDTVMDKLNELNTYADKTIYSFSDMTTNIGKFTNAGVSLDESVAAIQGVANVAAVSGANANEASRAMYNFAQALSAGYVKLIDWKSIENANMATVEFKTQLLETAAAAGTLKKTSDGMYKVLATNNNGSTMEQTISATSNFNDSLAYQWMTTEVLTKTLGDYADETTKIGKKAFAAAQDIKTFTQLMDTLKEAAGSGWAETWEIVFGDFEEAKALWTEVGDVVGGIIEANSEARNSLLQGWKDLDGRAALIDALRNAFEALVSVVKPIKKAFREIFPSMTSEQLYNITVGLRDFMEGLKLSKEQSQKVKTAFKGFFSILSVGIEAVKAVASGMMTLVSHFSDVTGEVLDAAAAFGKWAINTSDSIKETDLLNKAVEKVVEVLGQAIDKVIEFSNTIRQKFKMPGLETFLKVMQAIWSIVTKIGSKIVKVFGDIGSALGSAFRDGDMVSFLDFINSGIITGILLGIQKFVGNLSTAFSNTTKTLGKIKGVLNEVKGCLEDYQKSLKAKILLEIAAAIGILAVSLLLIATIDSSKLATSLGAVTVLFGELLSSLKSFSELSTGLKGVTSTIALMIGISVALLLLASALKKMASLDPENLIAGVAGLGAVMAELSTFMKKTELKGEIMNTAAGLVLIAAAMLLFASAVKKIGSMDIISMMTGLAGVMGILAALSMLVENEKLENDIINAAAGIFVISAALLLLASAVKQLGQMNPDVLIQGLLSVAAILSFLEITMYCMPKDLNKIGTDILLISVALKVMASAVSSMGSMSLPEIGKGLLAVGGSLAILAVALKAMKNAEKGAQSLLIASGALLVLTVSLKALGNMGVGEIIKSLVTLAGALTIIGVAAAVLAPVIPVLSALAGALALIGLAVLSLGAGLTLIGVGLASIGTAITTSATEIVAALTIIISGVVSLIPSIATEIAKGITAFCKAIGEGIPTILSAVADILTSIVALVVDVAPTLIDGIFVILEKLLSALVEYTPEFVQAGCEILISLLQGLTANIGEITSAAVDLIVAFIEGVASKIPDIIQAAFDLIISFINGLADAIDENTDAVLDAIEHLIEAVVKAAIKVLKRAPKMFIKAGKNLILGLIEGIEGAIKGVVKAAKKVAKKAVDTVKDFLGIHSPSRVFAQIGGYISEGMANGILSGKNKVAKSSTALAKVGVEAARQIAKSLKSSGSIWSEYVEETEDGSSKVQSSLETAAKAYKSFRNSIKESLESSMELFDAFELDTEVTSESLIENLQSQITGITEWAQNIQTLAERGVSKKLLKALTDLGIDGASYVSAMVSMSDKELKKLNKLYKKRMKLNSQSANEIAASFLSGGKKAGKAYADSITCTVDEYVASLNSANSNTAAVTAALTEIMEVLSWSFDDAVTEMAESLDYGSGAFQAFCDAYLTSTSNITAGTNAINAASAAISAYAQKVYEESDYYEEDAANLQAYQDELASLQKQKKKLQKQIDKAESKNTAASKKKAKALKAELKETKSNIKETKESILECEDEIAEHTLEVFNELRSTLSDSVATFLDPLQVSLESGVDLFSEWTSESDSYDEAKASLEEHQSELEDLQAQQEELQNEIDSYSDQNTLAARKRVKELNEQLSEIEEAIEEAEEAIADDEEEMASHSGTTADTILANMESQINGVTQWKENLESLTSKGLSDGLIAYLKELGTEGADYVEAFANMTEEEIEKANEFYAQSENLSAQTMLDNLHEQNDKAEEWAEGLQKMAEMGFSQDLIEQLGEAGVDSYDYVKAFLSMSEDQIAEYNDAFAESLSLPDTVADQVISSYAYAGAESVEGFTEALAELAESGSDSNEELVSTLTSVGETIATTLTSGTQTAAKKAIKTLIKTFASKSSDVEDSFEDLGTAATSALKSVLSTSAGKKIAKNIVQGLLDGLSGSETSISTQGTSLAQSLLKAVKSALGINSPSKEFSELGAYTDQGFVNGLLSGEDDVCQTAMDIMKKTIDDVTDAIDSNIDAEPVIRPVMDLTEIQNGASSISDLMNSYTASKTLNLATAAANSINGSNAQSSDSETASAIAKLQNTLSSFLATPSVEQNIQFSITGNDPKEIANEVSHILQQRVERRATIWA